MSVGNLEAPVKRTCIIFVPLEETIAPKREPTQIWGHANDTQRGSRFYKTTNPGCLCHVYHLKVYILFSFFHSMYPRKNIPQLKGKFKVLLLSKHCFSSYSSTWMFELHCEEWHICRGWHYNAVFTVIVENGNSVCSIALVVLVEKAGLQRFHLWHHKKCWNSHGQIFNTQVSCSLHVMRWERTLQWRDASGPAVN